MDPQVALAALPQRRNGFDYNSVMPTFRRFVANGYAPMDAAAITGNFAHEANIGGRFTPGAKEYNGGGGHGMGQWTGARWSGEDGLKKFAGGQGADWRDPQTQMDFFKYDAAHNGQAGNALEKMQAAPTLQDKTNAFMMDWERPRHGQYGNPNTYAGHNQRLEHANNILANAGNYGPPVPDVQSAAALPATVPNPNAPMAYAAPQTPAIPVNAPQIDSTSALSALQGMQPSKIGWNF